VTSATRPKWISDPLTATIGRIVMLEERVAECEQQREQIAHQAERIKFLEERLAQLTRPRDLLTEKEAAEKLRVHFQTLRDWRKERPWPRIPYILMEGGDIRYRLDDIENYLKSRERGAATAKKGARGE
jgi:Helix-turn-helix domain